MPKTPISVADYQRIFRTIYSVLEPDMPDPTGSCYYFNLIGAAILKEHYGIEAMPLVGPAAYCLDGKKGTILLYASLKENVIDPDGENVHCWLEADGWHIDFMAPLFPMIAKKGNLPPCKSKMMCKPLILMKESFNDLQNSGDFCVHPVIEQTRKNLLPILEKPVVSDFAQICIAWFRKPPQKMAESAPIQTDKGKIYHVRLTKLGIDGSW